MNRRRVTALFALVALLATGLRVFLICTGQPHVDVDVNVGYDEAVYVGASWLLRNGHLPYRDFVFVFPPGFLVVLWPVTFVSSLFGGPALTVTLLRIVAAAVGGVNTYLVARLGSRWLGWSGGIVAGMMYATVPAVVATESLGLQEPFVNLAVLAAYGLWLRAGPRRQSGPVLVSGILIGCAISIKLFAGVFIVPLLLVGYFRRPIVDRIRLLVATAIPLVVLLTVLVPVVGWRDPFRQMIQAQFLRPRDGAGLSRVNSLLPGLDERYGFGQLSGGVAWIALALFGGCCLALAVRRSDDGRLWGVVGLVTLGALMISPSYFPHYGSMLAPTGVLVAAWVAGSVLRALDQGSTRFATAGLLSVGLVIASVQLDAVSDAAAARVDRSDPVLDRRIHAADCIFAVRPQALIDANELPAVIHGYRALVDVYGSTLVAAIDAATPKANFGGHAFPAIQQEILGQGDRCGNTLLLDRACAAGRKDLSARTESVIRRRSVLAMRRWCWRIFRNKPHSTRPSTHRPSTR